MRTSFVRDVQWEQRGRSMAVGDGLEEKRTCGMTLPPAFGRERAALSVTDTCLSVGGDGISMRLRVPESVVNIAQIPKELTND
jgi:hypothetical protein